MDAHDEPPTKRPRAECQVALSDAESRLFAALRDAAQAAGLTSTMRVVGGWVRDKLRGASSNDVDIAVDNMKGHDFATAVKPALTQAGINTSRIGLVKSNLENCKHLETANMRIDGNMIDFVHLRPDDFRDGDDAAERFGTPREDAFRRDFTINTLFYNINTDAIEDWTGRGLRDLENQIIATPLPPRETFLDDPLRMLRGVRFFGRYGYQLDPLIAEACRLPEVKGALASKVSRERIGTEITKMLESPRPAACMQVLGEIGLLDAAFVSASLAGRDPVVSQFAASLCTAAPIERLQRLAAARPPTPPAQLRVAIVAAVLLPLCGKVMGAQASGRKAPPPLVAHVVRESLVWSNKDVEDVTTAVESSAAIGAFVTSGQPLTRLSTGMLLRQVGPLWATAAQLCVVRDPALQAPVAELAAFVDAQRLDGVWAMRPMLDGRQLGQMGFRPGKQFGTIMAAVIEWQLEHPEGTAEQLAAWVQSTFAAE